MLRRFAAEHDDLRDALTLLRDAADHVATGSAESAMGALVRAQRFLTERLLPHENAEQTELYPALATPLGSAEATATMSRTHAEIQRLSRSDRQTSRVGSSRRRDPARPDRRSAGLPVRSVRRCCTCTSCRKKRTTSPSQRTSPRRPKPPEHGAQIYSRCQRRGVSADDVGAKITSAAACSPHSNHRVPTCGWSQRPCGS